MSVVFDSLPRLNVQEVLNSEIWKPSDITKYDIPESPKPPTGKRLHALFEDTKSEALYLPDARLTAFRGRSKERFTSWIKAFEFRYHHKLGDLDDHHCSWVDKNTRVNGPIVEILIQIFNENTTSINETNKLLTFHLYPTTFLVTVQGKLHSTWAEKEFEYLKSLVDYECDTPKTFENILTQELSDTIYPEFDSILDSRNDNSMTHLKSASTPKNSDSKPKPQSILTPRLLIVKDENDNLYTNSITTTIQKIEGKLCDLTTTVDSLLEKVNARFDQLNRHELQLNETLKTDSEDEICKLTTTMDTLIYKLNKKFEQLNRHENQLNDISMTNSRYIELEKRIVNLQKIANQGNDKNEVDNRNSEAILENQNLKKQLTDLDKQLKDNLYLQK